jgi:uncharacterized membrane protein YgdD (TMEM256/DUF423 family)
MTRKFLITTSILGLLGVTMAILSTLFFTGDMSPENHNNFNTALSIHMLHTVALLAITFMSRFVSRSYLNIIFYLFTIGILLFSGSLYIDSTSELTNIVIGFMGSLTPIGGISLLGGWVVLLFTGVTYQHKKRAIHNS